jgi:Zn-dependent peptidase ImmA (M78 family)
MNNLFKNKENEFDAISHTNIFASGFLKEVKELRKDGEYGGEWIWSIDDRILEELCKHWLERKQ